MKNDLGMLYITRMDYQNTHGWWIRIYKRSKVVSHKLFTHNLYGGIRKSLVFAKQWRDKEVKRLKIVPGNNARWREHNKRNTSGVIGVHLGYKDTEYGTYYKWMADFTNDEGDWRHISFSINKYGWEDSFWKAVRMRHSKVGKRIPGNIVVPKVPQHVKPHYYWKGESYENKT